MGVEVPEEACSCQEESSWKKQKHNDEERSSSPEETSLVIDTESSLVLEKAQPCSETYAEIQERNGDCAQHGESNCLPLKGRQRVQDSAEKRKGTESIDINNGIEGSERKNKTKINNCENKCRVGLSGEMALCPVNEAQLDIENSASCKEYINGEIIGHSDIGNCSEQQTGNSADKAVEGEGEAILVWASLKSASADTPADSAGMEPMLKERGGTQEVEISNDTALGTEENSDTSEVQIAEWHKSCMLKERGGTQEVEISNDTALETEENSDTSEVQIAEWHKSCVDEVSEATSIGNGRVLQLPTTVFQEIHVMKVDIDKKVAIPSALEDLSKDGAIENDIASEEDTPQPLLSDSSHVSASEASKKKLLILDLNGLLADIIPYCNERYKHDFQVSHKYVYKRPHVDDFLQFCFERFAVAVWSSRTKRNIDPLLELLIGPLQTKLLFCWDQSHCTQTRFTTVDNRDKPLIFKELSKVWENHYDHLPWKKGLYNQTNTLLLDDSPYKALLNPANTAIFPSSYRYTRIHDNSLGPGGDLRVYLEGLAMEDNVQDYVKNNPFGQKPITESDSSWLYYQRVLHSHQHRDSTEEQFQNDAGKCSRRDDGRRWSRDSARHEYARKWARDDARLSHSRCDYAGKLTKGDNTRESETCSVVVGEKSTEVDTRESEIVGEFTSTTN